jgi:cellulase
MLALHSSQTLGGAQFYIGCAQLKVTGSGSGTCGPSIELPGAYKESDENIYIPKYYNGFDATSYKAPGGAVASCGGSGAAPVAPKPSASAAAGTPSAAASASASAAAQATPTPTPTQAAGPVKTPAAAPSAPASPVASSAPAPAPSSGASDGALPTEFTLKTFIAWLEGKANNASKARRHARAF